MRKTILMILLCGVMILGMTGCGNETKATNLKDTYDKISEFFNNDNVDRTNLGSLYLDEENNVIVVRLINNSKEKQEEFIKNVNVSSKYIKFEQGGPYTTSSIDFYVSKPENHDDIKFNDYYKIGDRTIYLAGNIDEFYVILENDQKITLKHYMSNICETFDESIKSITDNLTKESALKDGGTIIYDSKEKDITMVVCNTIGGNKNIYIGDYSMEYEQFMCQ